MYNIKIIEHANGSTQIKSYQFPIKKRRKKSGDLHAEDTERTRKMLEEFFQCEVKVVPANRLAETKEEREKREYQSMMNSINHTKKTINELARSAVWEYFVTLTFSPECIDRTDFDECMKKVRVWLNNQRKMANDLKYLCVPEMHKKRAENGLPTWHCHILMRDIGQISLTDSGKVAIGKKAYNRTPENEHYLTIYNLSGWKYGFSTAIRITNKDNRICSYMTKYITKDLVRFSPKRHRYYASNNLPKPRVRKGDISDSNKDIFIESYLKATGKEIVYEKTTYCYNQTKHIEAK